MKNKRTILKIVLIFVLVACKLLVCFMGVYKLACEVCIGAYQVEDFDAHKEDFEFLADMCFAWYDSKENADEYARLVVSKTTEWSLTWYFPEGDKRRDEKSYVEASAEEIARFDAIYHLTYKSDSSKRHNHICRMDVTKNQVVFVTYEDYSIIYTRDGSRPSSAHLYDEDNDRHYLIEHLSGNLYQTVWVDEPWPVYFYHTVEEIIFFFRLVIVDNLKYG